MLETRRIVHAAVTSSPTDAWVAQQLREATPWGEGPKYLIRDRDKKVGQQFTSVARNTGIEQLKTPYRAPKANAVCERYIGSMKRECLDYTLIFHRNHLSREVKEYVDYYNRSRPHQGIGQRIPARLGESNPRTIGKNHRYPSVGWPASQLLSRRLPKLKSCDWTLSTARLQQMVDGVAKVASRAKSD